MKKWWKSKTIWFNVITGALAVADTLGPNVIPADVKAAVVAIGNVLLRMITVKAVTK